jgi:hypothetical protein
MLSVITLNVIMLNVTMLNVIMLNVVVLRVTMLSVAMMSVMMLNVLAPLTQMSREQGSFKKCFLTKSRNTKKPLSLFFSFSLSIKS